MKLLGIDYGKKRVGIAVSDDAGKMAFPERVLPNDATFVPKLVQLITDKKIQEIVIGESKSSRGGDNAIQEAVVDLVTTLTLETGLPVHLEPEQYSTQEAIRFQGRTDKTDAAAASIILNSFITRTK